MFIGLHRCEIFFYSKFSKIVFACEKIMSSFHTVHKFLRLNGLA